MNTIKSPIKASTPMPPKCQRSKPTHRRHSVDAPVVRNHEPTVGLTVEIKNVRRLQRTVFHFALLIQTVRRNLRRIPETDSQTNRLTYVTADNGSEKIKKIKNLIQLLSKKAGTKRRKAVKKGRYKAILQNKINHYFIYKQSKCKFLKRYLSFRLHVCYYRVAAQKK